MTWDQIQSEFSRIESSSGNLSRHISNLVGAHRALISSELKEQRVRLIIAGTCFALTIALALCALIVIAFSIAEALSNEGAGLSRATALVIVGIGSLLLAGVSAAGGIQYLKKFSPVPHEGIKSFKETVSCLVKRQL